jgi:hypothetical protein
MGMSDDHDLTDERVVDGLGIPSVDASTRVPIRLLRLDDAHPDLLRAAGAVRRADWWWAPRTARFDFEGLADHLPRMARRALVPEIVDLIPASSWFSSLANLLTRSSWDDLRTPFVDHHGGCEDCGHGARLEAHERWSYDEVAGIQTLEGIVVLCHWCHETRHLGFARRMGRFDTVFARLCRINRIAQWERGRYLDAVESAWMRRSRWQWQLRIPLPEDVMLTLRPDVRHEGDGWLVRDATDGKPASATRVIDVGVGEMGGRVVLVGVGRQRMADAYHSSP